LQALGIDHFGIGRSAPKVPAFWQLDGHYRYYKMHIVNELAALLAVLDTEKPDVIVNFAAQGEGAASFGDQCADWYRTNVLGLIRMTTALQKRTYLKRFIQVGSSEVYGGNQNNAKETDPLRPTSPYGVSKAAFDQHLEIMHRVHGFPANVVRPVNCYVRGQQLHRIIPKAVLCALGGKKLPLQGGGKSEKSYLHSTDLSTALMTIIEKAPFGEVYNVGPEAPTAIAEVVIRVAEACGVPFDDFVEMAPERIGQDSALLARLIEAASARMGAESELGHRASRRNGRLGPQAPRTPHLSHRIPAPP
jgi:dTDP-glucose 4,6-dehydratase